MCIRDSVQNDLVSLDDLLNNELTTTNRERLLKEFLYNTGKMENYILNAYEGVEDVAITYIAKDTSTSIINSNKVIPVSVSLIVNSLFTKADAESIATAVASTVGNPDTDAIKVTSEGKVWFNGAEEEDSDELDLTDKLKVCLLYTSPSPRD